MTSQRLSKYDTIVIKDFFTEGAVYDNIDDEEKPKVDALKPLIVKNLTLSIEMEMKKRKLFKNVVLNSDAKENAVILEGSFTEFNVGSRALRFWVGFGAGKTYLKAKGRLIDAQTGKELASFEDQPFLKPGKDQKPKVWLHQKPDGNIVKNYLSVASAIISARSSTLTPSLFASFNPSSNMVMQYGQLTQMVSGFSSSASLTLVRLIRSPMCSSIHIRPPPAPQQKELFRLRSISAGACPVAASITFRGAS